MDTTIPQIYDLVSPGCYGFKHEITVGWAQEFLLISDLHFDAVNCKRGILKRHLDQALEKNAPVFIFGDAFDIMMPRQDPRGSHSALRQEYAGDDNYIFNVCNSLAEFLAPYADVVQLITTGNHELQFIRRHELDPLSVLASQMQVISGKAPKIGPYVGWIIFYFHYPSGGRRHSLKLRWAHGSSGSAPVTRGTIQTARALASHPSADIYYQGHRHHRWLMQLPFEDITRAGRILSDQSKFFLQGGCYVQDNLDPMSFGQQRGFSTAAVGGWWLRLTNPAKTGNSTTSRVRMQAIMTD